MKPLGFYEKVVVTKSDRFPELVGRSGYVLGISEESGTARQYAVRFLDLPESYCFYPDQLAGTGEFADRSLFFDDTAESRIRVRVVDGEGHVVDE